MFYVFHIKFCQIYFHSKKEKFFHANAVLRKKIETPHSDFMITLYTTGTCMWVIDKKIYSSLRSWLHESSLWNSSAQCHRRLWAYMKMMRLVLKRRTCDNNNDIIIKKTKKIVLFKKMGHLNYALIQSIFPFSNRIIHVHEKIEFFLSSQLVDDLFQSLSPELSQLVPQISTPLRTSVAC